MSTSRAARHPETSGAALSHAYWTDVVAPLLEKHLPGLPCAAARLGSGSDVLGLDDDQSRDHDWGLRLTLLVEDGAREVDALLDQELPDTWRGRPTRFATTWEPEVRHRCETATARDFTMSRLGADASRELTTTDWLSLTGQAVLEVTAGPVFHDRTGQITAIRERLEWYPHDLWVYAIGADWSRLAEEVPFVGRAGLRGDEAGSAVIAARLVRTMMHLAHLLHRRWPPYSKWLGTSFTTVLQDSRTARAEELSRAVRAVLTAPSWRGRQDAVARAAEALARMQGAAGLPTVTPVTEPFWDRPHPGIREQMGAVLRTAITDPAVAALPAGHGTAEQISDNVRVLVDAASRRRLVER